MNTHLANVDRVNEVSWPVRRSGSDGSVSAVSSTESIGHGVDVADAELEFAKLQRRMSEMSREISRTVSRQSHNSRKQQQQQQHEDKDLEKRRSIDQEEEREGEDEGFNVEAVLRGVDHRNSASGIKKKHVGVIWDKLSVYGYGGTRQYIKVFPDAFVDFINLWDPIAHMCGKRKGKQVQILQNFHGVLKPGEMCLVLGRPGSGCTTFLRTISNQRIGYSNITGEVAYGGVDAKTFGKYYRGECVYNGEDDIHHPSLTVEQTLGFALDARTPRKRPGGMTKNDFKKEVTNTLLKMFNIQHTRQTKVGNAFMRGVSGGERKRVSIAEMLITGAVLCAWDNTTRGLDSSTALDYAKSLRIMTDIYKVTTFVSLYQASENIFKQFDKVLLIDEGKQLYFGPATCARKYMEDLGFMPKPRQTSPDFLTGCTDVFERDIADNVDPASVPLTATDLASAYLSSKIHDDLLKEMAEYRSEIQTNSAPTQEFQSAVLESKQRGTAKQSVYTLPYYGQVIILVKRQFALKIQDVFSLVTSYMTSIVVAIITGTLFLKLPLSSSGAFTRGGAIFIALLFNALSAFNELASCMIGRPVGNKHKSYAFHRPSALWVAQAIVDIGFASIQILLYSIIVYFMCGLYLSAGAFFTFCLFIILGYAVCALFFRSVGCVCPDFDIAIKFAALNITLMVLTSGYLLPVSAMPWWVRWFYYINPLSYDFSSLMINEFKNINLTCTAQQLIPSGPGYTSIENQVCTLAGAISGTDIVVGSDYLGLTFSYFKQYLWRNFGILIAFFIFFLSLNAFLSEMVDWGAGGRTVTYFSKDNDERKRLNAQLIEARDKRREGDDVEAAAQLDTDLKKYLTWQGLNYDVPVSGGKRRLLRDVYGFVEPGKLTCLMGASGAGKTTLLDVLADRKNIGTISGDVLVDGIPRDIEFPAWYSLL